MCENTGKHWKTGKVDWNKADSWGRTPLYWALEGEHSDKLDIILQQPNIDYNVKTNHPTVVTLAQEM